MSEIRNSGKFHKAPSRRRRRTIRSTYSANTVHQAVLTLTSLSEQVTAVVEDVERFLTSDLRDLLDIRPAIAVEQPGEAAAMVAALNEVSDQVTLGGVLTQDGEGAGTNPTADNATSGKTEESTEDGPTWPKAPRRRLFVLT